SGMDSWSPHRHWREHRQAEQRRSRRLRHARLRTAFCAASELPLPDEKIVAVNCSAAVRVAACRTAKSSMPDSQVVGVDVAVSIEISGAGWRRGDNAQREGVEAD